MIDLRSKRRMIALIAVVSALLLLLGYVALNSGPLAPIRVVTTTVQMKELKPEIFGIGTIEARYSYEIGHNYTARVKSLHVDVGDYVSKNSILAEMEPIDLEERILSKQAALKAAEASILEAEAKQQFADAQTERYERLYEINAVSEDDLSAKRQTSQVTRATLQRAKEEYARSKADYDALISQRDELTLTSPTNGVVVARNAEVGSTVLGGQTLIELIDPSSIWVNVRFDQISASGLTTGLPATVTLRSQQNIKHEAIVSRVELKADSITEETLAKVVMLGELKSFPRIGELTEVTVSLPKLPAELVIPNAAIHRFEGTLGVWLLTDNHPKFVAVKLGRSDLEGNVQVHEGLQEGDRIILYSESSLSPRNTVHPVESLPGILQ